MPHLSSSRSAVILPPKILSEDRAIRVTRSDESKKYERDNGSPETLRSPQKGDLPKGNQKENSTKGTHGRQNGFSTLNTATAYRHYGGWWPRRW
jgi:hypothetical protein